MTARKVTAEPWGDQTVWDASYAELDDLCDRFAGNSAKLRMKVDCWLLHRRHRRTIARLARLLRRHPSTVRGYLTEVEHGLRLLHGGPLDELLGLERYAA